MKTNKKLNEGIRVAKEGIEECWDDMGGQTMTQGNGEQMSVTISMPGKNISVTTDSAEEIGSILRLAGINIGGGGVAGDVDGDGDHDIADHAAELGGDAEQVLYVGAGNPEEGPEEMSEPAGHEEEEEEPREAVGDTSTTHKGGTVTQTATGLKHQAGSGSYGGSDKEEEDTPASMYSQSAIPDKEVEESKKPDDDGDGVPNWADKHPGKDDQEFEESARILQLAGVTNEAQSAAQKAAFAKMIAKKSGKSDDGDDDNGSDATDDMADDKEEEVKEEAPATNSMFGQGVFEGEAESHDYIDYVNMKGQQPSPELTNQPGVEYDPESGIISVRNATSLANTHRSLEAAGWQKHALAARRNPAGAGQAKQVGDTAYQLESESARILELAGLEEARLMNSPAVTSMSEPRVYDSLPSGRGQGAGRKDYGANRANNQGENPMGPADMVDTVYSSSATANVEEAFQTAMSEYRKFVAENIARKK